MIFYKVRPIAHRELYLLGLFRRFILKAGGFLPPQADFYTVPFTTIVIVQPIFRGNLLIFDSMNTIYSQGKLNPIQSLSLLDRGHGAGPQQAELEGQGQREAGRRQRQPAEVREGEVRGQGPRERRAGNGHLEGIGQENLSFPFTF